LPISFFGLVGGWVQRIRDGKMRKQYRLIIEALKLPQMSINKLAKRLKVNWRTAKEVDNCLKELKVEVLKQLNGEGE
jgi:hypothetical protein